VKSPKTTGHDEIITKIRINRILRSNHFFSVCTICSLRDPIFFKGWKKPGKMPNSTPQKRLI
jgi:hypothetical protein